MSAPSANAGNPVRPWQWWLEIILVAAVYYCAAAVSMHFARVHGNAVLFWIPTGLSINLLLVRGYRMWPGIALGALAGYLLAPMGLLPAAMITGGNILEALFGAWLFKRMLARLSQEAGPYAEPVATVFVSLIAPIPSVLIGVFGLMIAYHPPTANLPLLVARWWTGNTVGALVVLPICLGIGTHSREAGAWTARRLLRLAAALSVVAGICWTVFYTDRGAYLIFALFPLILIGGAWFGQAGAQLVAAVIVLSSLLALDLGRGVVYRHSPMQQQLQLFVVYCVSVGLTTMMVTLLIKQRTLVIPGRIMVLGWLLGGVLFSYLRWEEEELSSFRFDRLITDTEQTVANRLDHYVEALTGGASLITADPANWRSHWYEFAAALRLHERYPGIRGIGVIEPALPEQVDALVRSATRAGGPPFRIHGVDNQDDRGAANPNARYVITHISQLELNRPALGLDLALEPHRKRAAELSRDTGRAVMTANITLVQDGQRRPGFLLLLPVYEAGRPTATVAQRRAALRCWIYAPFVTEEFFAGILSNQPNRPLVTVHDEQAEPSAPPLFRMDRTRGDNLVGMERNTKLVLAGRIFSMQWRRLNDGEDNLSTGPIWAGAVSSLVTLLVAALVMSLLNTTSQAKSLADQRTAQIDAMNQQLQLQFEQLSRAQADLVRLRQVHEFVLESVGDGIYAIDVSGKFIMQNNQSAKLLGWPSGELVGQPAHALVHHHRGDASPYPQADCPIHATIRDGLVRRVSDEIFWRRDGSSFPVEYTAAPLLDEHGVVIGATVTFKDVTARKQIELAQASMLEKARELSEMKSRFVSVTSHEFRTPLQVIESVVQLLEHHQQKFGPEKMGQLYSRIRSSVRRMTLLLEDLLIVNRLDAQRTKVNAVRAELVGVIQDLVEEWRMTDPHHHFAFEHPPAPCEAVVDTKLIYHVLSNLLSNAARYSPPGSTVTLSLQLTASELVLAVADTGMGIPAEDQQRIFEPFERGTNVGAVKGTGLGLNIVKRIVDMLGGAITVVSAVDHGTCLTVRIPWTRPATLAATAPV